MIRDHPCAVSSHVSIVLLCDRRLNDFWLKGYAMFTPQASTVDTIKQLASKMECSRGTDVVMKKPRYICLLTYRLGLILEICRPMLQITTASGGATGGQEGAIAPGRQGERAPKEGGCSQGRGRQI
jgi:hypothetical protein